MTGIRRPPIIQHATSESIFFKVFERVPCVTQESLVKLLENLPIRVVLRKRNTHENVIVPLEVEMHGIGDIVIYPPKGVYVAALSLSTDIPAQFHVDALWDTDFPGHGQVRACMHTRASSFGIEQWHGKGIDSHIKIDVYRYSYDATFPPILSRVGKHALLALFDAIAGGKNNALASEKIKLMEPILLASVMGVEMGCESDGASKDNPVRKLCAAYLGASHSSESVSKVLRLLEELRESIRNELAAPRIW